MIMKQSQEVKHLLQKHGIMRRFNISKVVNQKEIDSMYKKLRVNDKSSDTIKDVARRMVESMQAMDYHEYQTIPGVISETNKISSITSNVDKKKLSELLELANVFSHMLIIENLTPKESGYVLGLVIKNLNLNNSNPFKGFGQRDSDEDSY